MRCPFLREAQVKFCRASAYRKMIARLQGQPENERCTSPAYVHCPDAKQHHEEHPSLDHCPFLHESLVQYCSAASVTRYIPYSESVLAQCGTESHKYCELFLALAHPPVETNGLIPTDARSAKNETDHTVEGIRVPANLWFSPNHMWLDAGTDGVLHLGIDGFMAKALGEIDRLTFLTIHGFCRPTLVVTVRGVDLHVAFPNELFITKANTYLRTTPSRLVSDPYGSGWLFEGTDTQCSSTKRSPLYKGLITGNEATSWMRNEVGRMNGHVHALASRPDFNGAVMMADGGEFSGGLMHHLNREDILHLCNEFFSPFVKWRNAK